MEVRVKLPDEAATENLGKQLGVATEADGLVFLEGNLGAGKTTLSRGLIQGMGFTGRVKSPTYTLVEPYEFSGKRIYHFDLYRLADSEELEYMGMRDFLGEKSLCLIEWAERGADFLPRPDIRVMLSDDGEGRLALLVSSSEKGDAILARL